MLNSAFSKCRGSYAELEEDISGLASLTGSTSNAVSNVKVEGSSCLMADIRTTQADNLTHRSNFGVQGALGPYSIK